MPASSTINPLITSLITSESILPLTTEKKRAVWRVNITAVLLDLAKQKGIGPLPSFSEIHVLKTLLLLTEGSPIGRAKLSDRLRIGEGATRTLVESLRDAKLITVSKPGCTLTSKGLNLTRSLRKKLVKVASVPRTSISSQNHNYGVLVRQGADQVRNGLEQRDAAIRAGAAIGVTLVKKGGKLYIPPKNEFTDPKFEESVQIFETIFHPLENDVIIVCGAGDDARAEEGALAAASTLLDNP